MRAKSHKQPKCPSTKECINYLYIQQYKGTNYLLKGNFEQNTTEKNLTDTRLSEKSQMQKIVYYIVPFLQNSKEDKK